VKADEHNFTFPFFSPKKQLRLKGQEDTWAEKALVSIQALAIASQKQFHFLSPFSRASANL